MHNCRDVDALVTPYIDGELPDAECLAVDEHLRACPPCHSRVAAERTVRELLRARTSDLCASPAPEALRARCTRAAGDGAAAPSHPAPIPFVPRTAPSTAALRTSAPRLWLTRATPWALAASLVVLVGGAFLYQATDISSRVLAAELTADHVKCFAMNSALGTHDTASAVEAAMLSGFRWRMHLSEQATDAGLDLVGSRQCLYGEGRIAHIMYRHQGKPVSLFMLPRSTRAQELVEVLGHEAAIWCDGNRTFVLVSREPRRDVERIASLVQASLR